MMPRGEVQTIDADDIEHLIVWLRERPKNIHHMLRDFPCGAVVRASEERFWEVPGPGKTARIIGYREPTDDAPDGMLMVVGKSTLYGMIQTYVPPDGVEFVGLSCTESEVEILRKCYVAAGMALRPDISIVDGAVN